MFKTKFVATVALGFVLVSAPSALAVAIGSGDGVGDMNVTTIYSNGFAAAGQIQSASGVPVYVQGVIVYDFNSDNNCGRMTGDVTSLSATGVSGSCTGSTGGADGGKFQLCERKDLVGDECGSESATVRFN